MESRLGCIEQVLRCSLRWTFSTLLPRRNRVLDLSVTLESGVVTQDGLVLAKAISARSSSWDRCLKYVILVQNMGIYQINHLFTPQLPNSNFNAAVLFLKHKPLRSGITFRKTRKASTPLQRPKISQSQNPNLLDFEVPQSLHPIIPQLLPPFFFILSGLYRPYSLSNSSSLHLL